ncbi:trypsin alpha-like [Agrilus planipennis]|uniref:Trypsin alpha-like n=1 Tax=Agrilus planipennis TaxID=224129 RepID=A0A1W4X8Z1_AGRPL|nr:trypsin alpha-like [Agrilus planipennis]
MVAVLILAAFAPFALALPYQLAESDSTRISGGSNATIREIPYIVQINVDGSKTSDCDASIISRLWVVSAAHCLSRMRAANVSIRAGTDKFMRGGVVIRASNIYVHPSYSNITQDYDIGLIRLASPLTIGPNIASITLATKKPAVGASAVVSGWGDLDSTSETIPTQLQKVALPVVSDLECPPVYTPRMICAGYRNGSRSPCYVSVPCSKDLL